MKQSYYFPNLAAAAMAEVMPFTRQLGQVHLCTGGGVLHTKAHHADKEAR